jgi:hypothetical protein
MNATDMKKAVCWEMKASTRGMVGFRVIVADRYVLTQTLEEGNERPRWTIEEVATTAAASQRAVSVTDYMEREYHATLIVPPTEVVVHDAEIRALVNGGKIPSALRARAFTAFHRAKA